MTLAKARAKGPRHPRGQADHEAALDYLESLKPHRIDLGLERMVALASRLGHPEAAYPCLHVAGTNGKGSTCAMAEAGLRAAGLRTGLYTSPHLVHFEERIAVAGEPIGGAALAAAVRDVREAAVGIPLTYFEFVTAVAFVHFQRCGVDIAVLETGLGGRLDATNVATPIACGLTTLGLDHTEILGPTLAHIAREKAGILKPGVPCALAAPPEEARPILLGRARELGCELWIEGRDFQLEGGRYAGPSWTIDGLELGLRGPHQAHNGAVALALLELASRRVEIGAEAARAGLRTVRWPGRLELIARGETELLLDGAHNPQGAEALARALCELWPARRVRLVFGVLREKALDPMARALFPQAERALLTAPATPRARAPEEILPLASTLCARVAIAPSVAVAIDRACEGAGPGDLVVVCGSLYVIGEARAHLGL